MYIHDRHSMFGQPDLYYEYEGNVGLQKLEDNQQGVRRTIFPHSFTMAPLNGRFHGWGTPEPKSKVRVVTRVETKK